MSKVPPYDSDGVHSIVNWNDRPETTGADVQDWLKVVAKDIRNSEGE